MRFQSCYRKFALLSGWCVSLLIVPAACGLDIDDVLTTDTLVPPGKFVEREVPDTLDLTTNAEGYVNALTSNMEPENHYALWSGMNFRQDPIGKIQPTWNLPCKNVRALPFLRAMTGSRQNLNIEYGVMRAQMEAIGEDGLLYNVLKETSGNPTGTSYPMVNGIMIMAMMNWYHRDGNPKWLEWVDLMAKGLRKTAIQIEDRAYYPPESGIDRNGKWQWTTRGASVIPYTPPEEPYLEQQGAEGTVKFEQFPGIEGLTLDYRYNGTTASLEMAERLVKFCLKPGMWEDTSKEGGIGREHGVFACHFHGNLSALYSMLDYAVATRNEPLKQMMREGYEYARSRGVIHVGWFPGTTRPRDLKRPRPALYENHNEGCCIADMVLLGVKLSDAGLGDYWDDVDSIVRNQLTEQQFLDMDRMRKVSGGDPSHDDDLRRCFGGMSMAKPTASAAETWGCCTGNAAMAVYYAWNGITRFDGQTATVNMFLNRTSAWMDIDSYLPYEGKVVLHNKQARTAMVRIPGWVDQLEVRVTLNKKAVSASFAGRFLVLTDLKKGDEIRLEFPVPTFTEKFTMGLDVADDIITGSASYPGKVFTITMRGSTVVDIEPRDTDPKKYPLYMRDHLKTGRKAPMRSAKYFISEKPMPLR